MLKLKNNERYTKLIGDTTCIPPGVLVLFSSDKITTAMVEANNFNDLVMNSHVPDSETKGPVCSAVITKSFNDKVLLSIFDKDNQLVILHDPVPMVDVIRLIDDVSDYEIVTVIIDAELTLKSPQQDINWIRNWIAPRAVVTTIVGLLNPHKRLPEQSVSEHLEINMFESPRYSTGFPLNHHVDIEFIVTKEERVNLPDLLAIKRTKFRAPTYDPSRTNSTITTQLINSI